MVGSSRFENSALIKVDNILFPLLPSSSKHNLMNAFPFGTFSIILLADEFCPKSEIFQSICPILYHGYTRIQSMSTHGTYESKRYVTCMIEKHQNIYYVLRV